MLDYSCIVICIFSYTRLDGRAYFCMNLIPCINKAYVCMYVCMYSVIPASLLGRVDFYQKPIRVETCNGHLCAGKQASENSIC